MSDSLFKNKPIFVPKVLDSKIAELGFRFPAILVEAHISEWRPAILKKLKSVTDVFIINPATHRLLFKDSKDAKNFKKLSYPDVTPETLFTDHDLRTKKIIAPCIEDQINKGADVLIAPYLFAEDADDTKFSLNISILAETIKYVEEKKIRLPLFAMIHTGAAVLTRPAVVNFIIDRYRDEFSSKLSGYFITINDLDDRKADFDTLRGLAYMVFQLSRTHYVFPTSIGAFGEILSVLGASGFVSGLGSSETTSVKVLQDKPKKMSNRAVNWTYLPEILDYANDAEVKKINYTCSCPACKGSFPIGIPAKQQHFLYRRNGFVDALSKLSTEKKLDFSKERLEEAIKLARTLISKFGSPFKVNHLETWKRILEVARPWTYDVEDDAELDELLADLEK